MTNTKVMLVETLTLRSQLDCLSDSGSSDAIQGIIKSKRKLMMRWIDDHNLILFAFLYLRSVSQSSLILFICLSLSVSVCLPVYLSFSLSSPSHDSTFLNKLVPSTQI